MLPFCRDDALQDDGLEQTLTRAVEELQIMKRVGGGKHKYTNFFKVVAERFEQGGYTDRDADREQVKTVEAGIQQS